MKKKEHTDKVLNQVKTLVNEMDSTEKENLRDELLAFLLFGDTQPEHIEAANESLKGLTPEETNLIRKLARQTEDLYKASKHKEK